MPVATKLNLLGTKKVKPPHSLELVSIGKVNAEIIESEVNGDMNITGKTLAQITFPKDVLVTAIVRSGELITPSGRTKIEDGDILYILVSRESKKELRELLNDKKETLIV